MTATPTPPPANDSVSDREPDKIDGNQIRKGLGCTSGFLVTLLIAAALFGIIFLAGIFMLNTGVRETGQTTRHGMDLAADTLGRIFRTESTGSTVVRTVLGTIHSQAKLVVLTRDVEAHITKSDQKTLWGLNLGTTTVEVRTSGRVQYSVPLEELSEEDFQFLPEEKRVVVTIPRPQLDTDMVEVESDPAKLEIRKEIGWARLESYSGKYLEDEARRELRLAVLQAGSDELVRDQARRRAREEFRRLLKPLVEALQKDVKLEIKFPEPVGPEFRAPDPEAEK